MVIKNTKPCEVMIKPFTIYLYDDKTAALSENALSAEQKKNLEGLNCTCMAIIVKHICKTKLNTRVKDSIFQGYLTAQERQGEASPLMRPTKQCFSVTNSSSSELKGVLSTYMPVHTQICS